MLRLITVILMLALTAPAWYRLNKIFAIGLTANRDENVLGFGIGGRIYFGR